MTLYRETPCEHGRIDDCDAITTPTGLGRYCPGGSREEVTIDYEAAEERFIAARALIPALSMSDTRALAESIIEAALGR